MDKYRKVMKPKETALGLLGAKPALGTLGWSSFEPNMFEKKDQSSGGWLVVSIMNFIFHFIYGMSSFPLTNSIIFQDGHIAPPTSVGIFDQSSGG